MLIDAGRELPKGRWLPSCFDHNVVVYARLLGCTCDGTREMEKSAVAKGCRTTSIPVTVLVWMDRSTCCVSLAFTMEDEPPNHGSATIARERIVMRPVHLPAPSNAM